MTYAPLVGRFWRWRWGADASFRHGELELLLGLISGLLDLALVMRDAEDGQRLNTTCVKTGRSMVA